MLSLSKQKDIEPKIRSVFRTLSMIELIYENSIAVQYFCKKNPWVFNKILNTALTFDIVFIVKFEHIQYIHLLLTLSRFLLLGLDFIFQDTA